MAVAANGSDKPSVGWDYADHFWGDKHYGYHVLSERRKHGEQAAAEVLQFVKDRLSHEEDVLRGATRSINKVSLFVSNGSALLPGWTVTKGTLELFTDIQGALIKNLQDVSRECARYQEELVRERKERKPRDNEVVEAVSLMQTTTTCLQKAKETYATRYVEWCKMRDDPVATAKETNKAEHKFITARDDYMAYVDKYEKVRVEFERHMSGACSSLEAHDRALFSHLTQLLLQIAAHQQEAAAANMQIASQFRESVQSMCVEDYLTRFVQEKATGSDRPQRAVVEEARSLLPASLAASLPPHTSRVADEVPVADLLETGGEEMGGGGGGELSELSPAQSHSPVSGGATAGAMDREAAASLSMSNFSSSFGSGTKKLSMWLPKRKKHHSISGTPGEIGGGGGAGAEQTGFLKFRPNKKKKSSANGEGLETHGMEDAQSTASSSKSDDKSLMSGPRCLLDSNIPEVEQALSEKSSVRGEGGEGGGVDAEGYTVRQEEREEEKEDTNWSSCSSDEEDENELQQSRIRNLVIRPAGQTGHSVAASVEELRDAVGLMSLARSSTFDRQPWLGGGGGGGSARPAFSQSLQARPLRPAYTGDDHLRAKFDESEFCRSNVPLSFSASMSATTGMARARPRSNTPSASTLHLFGREGSASAGGGSGSQEWAGAGGWGSQMLPRSDSTFSIGDPFAPTNAPAQPPPPTISEHRVPVAMAVHEYTHAWFRGADVTKRTVRVFGTVMVSFAASSLPLLTDVKQDMEAMQFRLVDADQIKAVLPNKQLLVGDAVSSSTTALHGQVYKVDRLALANWLLAQQREKGDAAFYNAEIVRYELGEWAGGGEPPLLMTTYTKSDEGHVDMRVDYRLNTDSVLSHLPLHNVRLSAKVDGGKAVEEVTSDPPANWDGCQLTWQVGDVSRGGVCAGSLKARLRIPAGGGGGENGNGVTVGNTTANFQLNDASISGVGVEFVSCDTYHLSMLRRKVLAGKYFCEPELRK